MVAFPVPDVGVTDAHELSLTAFHAQAECVASEIWVDPDCAVSTSGTPPMLYEHGAPC
jgi:hypothetical protein